MKLTSLLIAAVSLELASGTSMPKSEKMSMMSLPKAEKLSMPKM